MKKVVCLMLVFSLFCSIVPALAAGESETLSVTYVPIVGSPFVVDTLNGVQARYSSKTKLYCIELVQRYYREIYGLSISTGYGGPKAYSSSSYFEVTTDPKPGDVAYAPSYLRSAGYAHWALVKSYSEGVVTLIEQNWKWNGKAAYERKISCPNNYYTFYTLKGAEPLIDISEDQAAAAGEEDKDIPSDWAQDSAERAAGYGIDLNSGYQKSITKLDFCRLAVQAVSAINVSIPEVCDSPGFTDTQDEFVCAAYRYGLVTGSSQTTFSPQQEVDRETAAVILFRLTKAMGLTVPESDLSGFSDLCEASDWAQEGIAGMSAMGVLKGCGSELLPRDKLTNEAAMVLLVRLIDIAVIELNNPFE